MVMDVVNAWGLSACYYTTTTVTLKPDLDEPYWRYFLMGWRHSSYCIIQLVQFETTDRAEESTDKPLTVQEQNELQKDEYHIQCFKVERIIGTSRPNSLLLQKDSNPQRMITSFYYKIRRFVQTGTAIPLFVMPSRISFSAWHIPTICKYQKT